MVEKSPECNSLFLLFHFQSISHIVNILVSAIENLFQSLVFYQLSLFSNCREVRLLWKSPVTAFSILVFAICSCLVSSVRPSLKRLMTRLNRHRSEINSFSSTASFSNLCGFIPYNLSSLTKVIEYRLIREIDDHKIRSLFMLQTIRRYDLPLGDRGRFDLKTSVS